MSLLWAGLIVILASAVTISAMLFVRRTAPEGSYFEDGDRAAGVFGVIATGFAVMLGFVIFLAFESYDTSRSGAEDEATVVAQQFQTAQLLPAAARQPLSDALVCYARNVVDIEWPQMRSGRLREPDQPVGRRDVQGDAERRAEGCLRAGGVQQMARPDDRPPDRPATTAPTAPRA